MYQEGKLKSLKLNEIYLYYTGIQKNHIAKHILDLLLHRNRYNTNFTDYIGIGICLLCEIIAVELNSYMNIVVISIVIIFRIKLLGEKVYLERLQKNIINNWAQLF